MIIPSDYRIEKYGLKARFVEESDAEFIVDLRTNPLLSRYIHATNNDAEKQRDWIRNYKKREAQGSEYYFIFYFDEHPIGLERIYDMTSDSYTHGSLVFSPEAPIGSSVKADIITREIGFNILEKQYNYFAVSKGNNGVIAYHKRYRPEVLSEDDISYYYKLTKENFDQYKSIYIRTFNIK